MTKPMIAGAAMVTLFAATWAHAEATPSAAEQVFVRAQDAAQARDTFAAVAGAALRSKDSITNQQDWGIWYADALVLALMKELPARKTSTDVTRAVCNVSVMDLVTLEKNRITAELNKAQLDKVIATMHTYLKKVCTLEQTDWAGQAL